MCLLKLFLCANIKIYFKSINMCLNIYTPKCKDTMIHVGQKSMQKPLQKRQILVSVIVDEMKYQVY